MTNRGIESVFCAVAVGKSSVKKSLCPEMIIHSVWTATTIFMLKSVQPAPNPLLVSEVPSLSVFKTASGTVNALTVGSARSPWWGKAS